MLKDALTSYPVLRLADVSRPFLLYTDASGYAVGALLAQIYDDGKEYVVAYASRLMTKHEINYGITEKECLAVMFGIKTFRNYLHGVKFKVITDQTALAWLKSIKEPNTRLTRWAIYLQSYDCEIIHRKGVNHSNVDALSRPVESINFTIKTVVEDASAKSLDPWEDESLIHYLKFGRFISGTSKKQIKRITSLVQKYLYQNDKLYVIKDDRTLKIPKPEERLPLIEKAHALGHFQAESTYNGLKDKFYWKRMLDDLRKVIKQCLPCQRNNKMVVKYHPAIAIKVGNVFDRIQIDLVLGLMETPDGYIGILEIIESHTKFPYAKPIKSKTAKEIARLLLEFFSLFGTAKEILSDQGREFVNEIIAQLKNNMGFEHTITSAYNPRTNGLTERLNQTLVESLRKHCESDKENWPKHLDYVLMAYRPRVHSVIKLIPFELMFGRKMNGFENWSSSNENDESEAIVARSQEIKNMIENSHNTAKENIEEAQKRQITLQNNNLKNSNWQNREKLPESYPRHKLKIVEDNQYLPEESAEIERILGHKVIDNNFHYLVKWKDFPVKEETWIPETYFNSMDLINKYKESLKDKVQLRKRGTKKINSLTLINFLILSSLIISIVSGATIKTTAKTTKTNNSTKSTLTIEPFNVIRDNFRACTGETDKNLINLNDLCKYEPDGSKRIVENYLINEKIALKDREETKITMHILGKTSHDVYGNGIHCIKKKHILTTSTNMLWAKYESFRTENVKLTREECFTMNYTRKCGDNSMECDGNYCSYSSNPIPEFSWWSEVTTIFYSCTISPKLIAAKNISDNLFNTKCKAKDKFCSLHDSIIVWDDTLYHSCPLYEISKESFVIHLNARNPDVLVALPNMSFQAIKTEKICGLNTMHTTEGVYLSLTKNTDVAKHPKNGADINEIKEILLANIDFVSHTEAVE
ncbi:unnamed protein product, partial [Brachionus calyciflorus]